MNDEFMTFNSLVLDYGDGTQAIWALSDGEVERLEHYLVTTFGQPDTLNT